MAETFNTKCKAVFSQVGGGDLHTPLRQIIPLLCKSHLNWWFRHTYLKQRSKG